MPVTRPYNVLVLDIDETLVWTQLWPDHDCDFYIDSRTNGDNAYGVLKRPGVDAFLRWCFASHELFRTAIWTAGSALYAQEICEGLLLPSETPEFVWASNRCSRVLRNPLDYELGLYTDELDRYLLLKDFKKLRRLGYDLNRLLHLDNTPEVARRNYGNLVVMPTYQGEPEDRFLEMLQPHLEKWFSAPEGVRRIDKRGWWRKSAAPTTKGLHNAL